MMNALLACTVCFGDPNSQQAQAQNFGIFVLLGVTGFVLAGFAALGIYFVRRARRYRAVEEVIAHIPAGLPEIG